MKFVFILVLLGIVHQTFQGCVKATTSVNLRNRVAGSKVGRAYTGQIFEVENENAGYGWGLYWYKFESGEYAAKKYFKSTSCPQESFCVKAKQAVNVRDDVAGNKLFKAYAGQIFEVVDESAGSAWGHEWYEFTNGRFSAKTYFSESSCDGDDEEEEESDDEELEKQLITLKKVFGHEGGCQNGASDNGNWLNGKLGYTCAGITPGTGWNNRNKHFSYAANSYTGSPELFVKYAYEKSKSKFEEGSAGVYVEQYFYMCEDLPLPSYYVCSDVSVNSGPGRAKKYLNQLSSVRSSISEEEYATRFNQKHREYYLYLVTMDKYKKYKNGWLARADSRDDYIESYCRTHNCD